MDKYSPLFLKQEKPEMYDLKEEKIFGCNRKKRKLNFNIYVSSIMKNVKFLTDTLAKLHNFFF